MFNSIKLFCDIQLKLPEIYNPTHSTFQIDKKKKRKKIININPLVTTIYLRLTRLSAALKKKFINLQPIQIDVKRTLNSKPFSIAIKSPSRHLKSVTFSFIFSHLTHRKMTPPFAATPIIRCLRFVYICIVLVDISKAVCNANECITYTYMYMYVLYTSKRSKHS